GHDLDDVAAQHRASHLCQEAISFTHSTPKSGNEWGRHTPQRFKTSFSFFGDMVFWKVLSVELIMPQSYVYFKDNGFWATDAFLRDWLRLVILQLDQDKEPPQWAKEMRGYLYDQATTHMHGCMDCHLDKFMISDARKDYLLACSKRALDDIEAGLPQVASYAKEADPVLLQFSVLTNYIDWVCCIGWG